MEGETKKILRWTALGALFLIPLMPLIVANTFFFPFITGKGFFFRILTEVIFCAWVGLAVMDKAYRPRFSWIGAAALAFVVWMFIADSFAINAAKAFWSNFERMEGWVLLIHLLAFFFASSAVLRVEKKWRTWFLVSLGVSVVISLYAFLQIAGVFAIHQGSTRIDATLGNSAYLAIYLLFSGFVALWLALTEKSSWLKWSLIVLAVVEGFLLFMTETRGTVLGLVLALILAAALTAVTAGKRVRSYAVGGLLVLLVAVGTFYLARNSAFVQNNHTLQRVASISLSDGSTRFTIWHMAYQGFLANPILGYGQEGFNYVFNTYFEPSMYGQESWFDRAHNAFIDWLSAGGLPAFFLYISLFVTAVLALWRNSTLSRPERIALTSALVGYAVHNLFVFDNLYSYVYFFAILALIDSQVGKPIARFEKLSVLPAESSAMYVLPMGAVGAITLIWLVNVPGMNVASGLITALSPNSAGIAGNISTFETLSAHPAFAGQEVREQLVSFANSAVQNQSVSTPDKQKIVTLAVTEMQKQVASYPLDARLRLQLASAYRAGGDAKDALVQIKAAQQLSPKKQEILIQAAATEWDLGDLKAAQADFNSAYALSPTSTDLAGYAAAGDYGAGDVEAGDKVLMGAFGTTNVDSDILAVAYYRAHLWPRLIGLWKLRVSAPSATAQTWFALAAAYYVSGDKASAIATINTAVAKYPDAATSGAAALEQIKSGK